MFGGFATGNATSFTCISRSFRTIQQVKGDLAFLQQQRLIISFCIYYSTEGLHVAVLHPMHLRILRIVINENTELNSHCTVDFMYEHRLPLHGYTLIAGPSNVVHFTFSILHLDCFTCT